MTLFDHKQRGRQTLCLLLGMIAVLFCMNVPAVSAADLPPLLTEPGALGSTAERIGGEIALYGKNVFSTTRVKFKGNVWATKVREYPAGITSSGLARKDRIIVTVPKGARPGPVTVCNGSICETTKSSLIIVPPLHKDASISLISPDDKATFTLGQKVDVRYLVRNWNKKGFAGTVDIFLEKESGDSVLVGRTDNTKRFSFVMSEGKSLGVGEGVFRIRVCNMWREVCDASDRPFSVVR